MIKIKRRKLIERVLAGVLSLFMIMTMCPDAYMVVRAAPGQTNSLSGKITNSVTEKGIKGATVVLTHPNYSGWKSDPATTD